MILILSLALVASCTPIQSDQCAGWGTIRAKDASIVYLGANDPQMLGDVVAHVETGQKRGCWN